MMKTKLHPMPAIAAAGLLTAALVFGRIDTTRAQVPPPPPVPPPTAPVPPPPPAPVANLPVDSQAAPTAVKTSDDALAGLSAGQVWTRTAPLGEQQAQATLLLNGKEVARLDFDPATGLLRARGEGAPLPPAAPRGPGALVAPVPPPGGPVPPPPGVAGPVPPAPVPPLDATAAASAATISLDQIKARLPGIVKGLSVGQGAEIMSAEGFWKVPLIFQNRVVGELHLSGDGTKVVQDFMAARDAAIFAR